MKKIIADKMVCQLIVFKNSADGSYIFMKSDGKWEHVPPMPGPGGAEMIKNKLDELMKVVAAHPTVTKLSKEERMNVNKLAVNEINSLIQNN